MIRFTFDPAHTPKERHHMLEEYDGQRVTVALPKGTQVSGMMTLGHTRVDLTDPNTGASAQIDLKNITTVWVYTGGDWASATGHKSGTMTERIHVRCTEHDKAVIAAKAERAGMSMGEYVRRAALEKK